MVEDEGDWNFYKKLSMINKYNEDNYFYQNKKEICIKSNRHKLVRLFILNI